MDKLAEVSPQIERETNRILFEHHASVLNACVESLETQWRSILHQFGVPFTATRSALLLYGHAGGPPLEFASTRILSKARKGFWEKVFREYDKFATEASKRHSAYVFPSAGGEGSFQFALVLILGEPGGNQRYRGIVQLFAETKTNPDSVPLDLPTDISDLPQCNGYHFLPLSPRWERSAERTTWINIPVQLKRTTEWEEFESHVLSLETLSETLTANLVPILSNAAWRTMAERVMHELTRTVTQPRSTLNAAEGPLSSALAVARRANLSKDSGTGDLIIRNLLALGQNLSELAVEQAFVESKVNWFFELVANESKSDSHEPAPLVQALKDAIQNMGRRPEEDALFENSQDPLWQTRLSLPRLFPQHSFEALISNSFVHRSCDEQIPFSIGEEESDILLEWRNPISPNDARQLKALMAQDAALRTFGLRLANDISVRFFGSPIEVDIEDGPEDLHAVHRLKIPSSLVVQAPPAARGSGTIVSS